MMMGFVLQLHNAHIIRNQEITKNEDASHSEWVRPKSDISARSALSAVCSKLPSD